MVKALLLAALLALAGCTSEVSRVQYCTYAEGEKIQVRIWNLHPRPTKVAARIHRVRLDGIFTMTCHYLIEFEDTHLYPQLVWIEEDVIW